MGLLASQNACTIGLSHSLEFFRKESEMTHANIELLDRFFAAYGSRDLVSLRGVLAEQATWTFPGHHPLSGTRVGVDAIVAFFDAMGAVMAGSNVNVEKLVMG